MFTFQVPTWFDHHNAIPFDLRYTPLPAWSELSFSLSNTPRYSGYCLLMPAFDVTSKYVHGFGPKIFKKALMKKTFIVDWDKTSIAYIFRRYKLLPTPALSNYMIRNSRTNIQSNQQDKLIYSSHCNDQRIARFSCNTN